MLLEREYQRAEALRENRRYAEAYAIYVTIQGYKDVDEIMTSDAGIAAEKYRPGSHVTLGAYPQTESGADDTPIEWLVLESDGETALLISRYALDCQPYHTEFESVTWKRCTLRGWLNDEFLSRAFSKEESRRILDTANDRVFLLSFTEAKKLFVSDEARMCTPTDYAIAQGVSTIDVTNAGGRGNCRWWLRSPGINRNCAASVSIDGSILYDGGSFSVYCSDFAVRPCVRVRLS